MSFKLIAMILITVSFLYRLFLQFLRIRSADNPIPENVSDVYDGETYLKWHSYQSEKNSLSILAELVSYLTLMTLISFNFYARFAQLFPDGPYVQMIAVLLLDTLAGLLLLPFEWYDTFVIEEKYGFNKTTVKTFIADQVKNLLLNLLLTVGLGAVLTLLHMRLGDGMVVLFAAVLFVFVLAVAFLFPYFSRLFNKFTPLEDGELKDKLTALLTKYGFSVRSIEVMDASRRSTKSNAYFTGFGKTKTIVLYDTLVASITPDEICAVFAHEMGHGLHKDTLKNQILNFVNMAVMAVLVWLTVRTPAIFRSFCFAEVNYGLALILVLSVEFALYSPLFSLLTNAFSRRAEYRADAQAVSEGLGCELISGLKKLSRENFAELAPSPLTVALEYSHPTLSQRIEAIEKND